MLVDIFHCARCGEDHKALSFVEFSGLPIIDEAETWSHWAACPKTNDPILLRVEIDKTEEYQEYKTSPLTIPP